MSLPIRNSSYLHIQCQSLFFSTKLFFCFFFCLFVSANEMKILIIERHRITNYQLTIEYIYMHNPNKREPKQMLNIINPSINQHTKAILNSIIPKTTYYINEVMFHRLGLKVGICVWPRDVSWYIQNNSAIFLGVYDVYVSYFSVLGFPIVKIC